MTDETKEASLLARNTELLAAVGELLTAREYVLDHGGDILTSASWGKAERAFAHE